MVTRSAADNDLGQIIGELRSFAAQQVSTNSHMLEELKKIGDRLGTFGEMGATFTEYRKTNHERWNRVHEQMGEIDERMDKVEAKVETMNNILIAWQSQMKM